MDHYSRDNAGKMPNTQANQAGLEVDSRPPPPPPSFYPSGYVGEGEAKYERSEKRKILGLSVGVFWAVVVVLFLLLAGGIGGGVGAGLASQKKTCDVSPSNGNANGESINNNICTTTTTQTIGATPSATPSSTTPSSALISPRPVSPCTLTPSVNNTIISPLSPAGSPFPLSSGGSQTFRILCNTNYPGGAFYGNDDVFDLQQMYVPTLELCVQACAAYNIGVVRRGGASKDLCRVAALVVKDGEACYFKNATGKVNNTGTSGAGVRIDSAVLL